MITVEQFKGFFVRDFPYLPYWEAEQIYFSGDIVYSAPNFYQSLVDSNVQPVSNAEAWKPVKGDVDNYLSDADIQKAIQEAKMGFNESLFENNETEDYIGDRNLALMYLTAYYLVMDIKNSTAGLSSNGYASFVSSKSVGGVSESYGVPSWVSSDPMLSLYMDNGYGKKYVSMLWPRARANSIMLACGGTTFD